MNENVREMLRLTEELDENKFTVEEENRFLELKVRKFKARRKKANNKGVFKMV